MFSGSVMCVCTCVCVFVRVRVRVCLPSGCCSDPSGCSGVSWRWSRFCRTQNTDYSRMQEPHAPTLETHGSRDGENNNITSNMYTCHCQGYNVCVSPLTKGVVGGERGQGVVVGNGGRVRADSLRLRLFLHPPRFTGSYRQRQKDRR